MYKLTNTIIEIKNPICMFTIRLDASERRLGKVDNRSEENIQTRNIIL